jgi:quinol monooxygenase YgiN
MIKIVAKNLVKADKMDAFLDMAKVLVRETREKDAGCIRYELVQGIDNPRLLTFLEEWEDQESLDKHMAAPHFQDIVPRFADCLEEPVEVTLYKELL